jgi:hypothetical protein
MRAKKKYSKGGKVGDPKKKKDDKSFTTLRETPAREKNRPTEAELKYMLKGPGSDRFLKELPKVIKAREAMEKRNPVSGKTPKYMYGGKVYAESGAMIKAMLKDPKQAEVARKELGMD